MLFKNVEGFATVAVATVVNKISRSNYGGNLTVEARTAPSTRKGNACRFVLRCKDSHAAPARRSGTGRLTNAANWEAHRLVMQELFNLYPTAQLVTALTTYTSKDDFERRHRDTYEHNAGSKIHPVAFGTL